MGSKIMNKAGSTGIGISCPHNKWFEDFEKKEIFSKEELIKEYTEKHDMTVEGFRKLGLEIKPCKYNNCFGWCLSLPIATRDGRYISDGHFGIGV